MYIISGSASKTVAEDLSKELRVPLARVISKRFPDDELYIRIVDDISGEDAIIVQTTYPDPNIVELFILQDAVKEANANKVTVVIPYFGYARQDKKFENGEPISAKAIASLVSLNADKIITVDPHKQHVLDFFTTPAFSCSAVPQLARYLKKKDVDMVVAPDEGALDRAKKASKIINCDFDYMEKKRLDGSTVEIKPKNLKVHNKNVAIIDDIISTGGTMASCIKELKKHGATRIFVACTHGLFVGESERKLIAAGCNEIISTDTIQNKYSKVKVTPAVAEKLDID